MKKDNKNQRRKEILRDRERAKRQRTVVIRDGEKRTVIQVESSEGYDVNMVRDFLGQLLLELRVQHYENLKLLNALREQMDIESAIKVREEISEDLVAQLAKYQRQHHSVLLAADAMDGTNTTDAEKKAATMVILQQMAEKRDEQIGHLEALQDLFEEALLCARVPLTVDAQGNLVLPERVHNIREMVDQAAAAHLPKYEDLLPLFPDHPFAKEEGIAFLKQHDRTDIIMATNDAYDEPLVLYGIGHQEGGKSSVMARAIPVTSFRELQFVIAAIHKFVGIPSTDGEP